MSDTIKGRIYYVKALDQFHLVVPNRKPTTESWVAVKRWEDDGIAVQQYYGQPYVGVVRWLRPYRLTQSEQQSPSRKEAYDRTN